MPEPKCQQVEGVRLQGVNCWELLTCTRPASCLPLQRTGHTGSQPAWAHRLLSVHSMASPWGTQAQLWLPVGQSRSCQSSLGSGLFIPYVGLPGGRLE